MIENINWYPGHMKKTRELILENLKLVDIAVEVIDARIPISSRNPVIDEILKNKKRLVVLNKSDLSDNAENEKWERAIEKNGFTAIPMNCAAGTGVPKFMKLLNALQEQKNSEKARKKPLRLMVVGVPNSGKSSLINRLTGKKSAKTGDKPGVTRGKQWLNLDGGIQLLDTPGILWPKFEDPKTGNHLAFCASVKNEILDREDLALALITVLQEKYPKLLCERYKLESLSERPLENMEEIAKRRGFVMRGGKIDYERVSRTVLDEFRAGRIGKITLEQADEVLPPH